MASARVRSTSTRSDSGPTRTRATSSGSGDTCFAIWQPAQFGVEYQPQANSIVLLHVDDVPAARAELEAKGVEFHGETFDTGVCHMANFTDPDGNPLTLHKRYAPYEDEAQA